jgi:energy-coupling factor transporter ATP-binding protein EcfA2
MDLSQVAGRIIAGVFIEVFKKVFQGTIDATSSSWRKSKEDESAKMAAERYRLQVLAKYDYVRVFDMTEHVLLSRLYVPARVSREIISRRRMSMEDIRSRLLSGADDSRQAESAQTVIEKHDRVMLLGPPGSGKTTLCKAMLGACVSGAFGIARIPLFVELRRLGSGRTSVMEALLRELEGAQLPNAEQFLRTALSSGKCFVLFDGLDEVVSERQDVIQQLIDISDTYAANKWIITCREAAYESWFDKFVDVELIDFGPEQVGDFVRKWFSDEPAQAEEFLRRMPQRKEAVAFSANPLLLTLMCMSFGDTLSFPANRAELFRDALDALLRRWDVSRRISRPSIYGALTLGQKEALLSRIAARAYEDGDYEWIVGDLVKEIEASLEYLPGRVVASDPGAVLEAIEVQHGLLVKRARDVYTFSHVPVQEYFTAKYIVDNGYRGTVQRLLLEHVHDERWRDVIVLTACLMTEADDFVATLLEEVNTRLKDIDLNLAIAAMAERSTESAYAPVVTFRLGTLYVLYQVFRHARRFDRALQEVTGDPARDDAQALVRSIADKLDATSDDLFKREELSEPNELVQSLLQGRPARANEAMENARQALIGNALKRFRTLDPSLARRLDLECSAHDGVPLLLERYCTMISALGKDLLRLLKLRGLVLDCLAAGCGVSARMRTEVLAGLLSGRKI